MSNMSGYQKFLYIMSIIIVVVGALYLILGAIVAATGTMIDETEAAATVAGLTTQQALAIQGGALIVGGIIEIIVGILGIRGARNPEKIKPYKIIIYIVAVLGILGLISEIATGTFTGSSLSALIPVILAYAAYKVDKEVKGE